MTFDRARIIAEGGTYHGHENPLIERAPFDVLSSSYLAVAETGDAPAYIKEDASLPKRMVIEGVFQRADMQNANKRVYPRTLWSSLLSESSPVQQRIAARSMIGHLEHPETGTTDLNKGAILVTKVWMESDGTVKGRAIVYNTPEGLRLQEYIATGTRVGISSRGTGTVDKNGVVQEDFQLETWDMVYNPSTPGAHPTLQRETTTEAIQESKSQHSRQEKRTMTLSQMLAEHTVAVQTLLAVDATKLGEDAKAAHVAQLLDMRVTIAEAFTGERRVKEVDAILASLDAARSAASGKVQEDTMSGSVGGFRSSADNAQGNPPGGMVDRMNTAMAGVKDTPEKQEAWALFARMADLIAANVGVLPRLSAAVAEVEKGDDRRATDEALLREAAEELETLTVRESAAAALIAEMGNTIKALKLKNDKLTSTVAAMSAKKAEAEPKETKTESKEATDAPTKRPTLAERLRAMETAIPKKPSSSRDDATQPDPVQESEDPSMKAARIARIGLASARYVSNMP